MPPMPWWQWVAEAVGTGVLVVVLYGVVLVLRRRWIARSGGTFDLSHRAGGAGRRAGSSRGWVLGVGRYSADRLEFFRVFSVAPRPRLVLQRSDLTYGGQRTPVGNEAHALYAGHVVLACSSTSGSFELAMAPGAVTGFLAWLEAVPPGARRLPH